MALAGHHILITGAGSGLGLEVSKRVAQQGANLILVCRTEGQGEQAVAEVERAAPEASVRLKVCDLASLASTERLVCEVRVEAPELDLLFNNAAVMKRERTLTEDGFETMFQVNYLAPFILMTRLLEPLGAGTTHLVLNNGRPSDRLRLDFDDLQFATRYRTYNSFFRTKLCLLLATLELAQRPEASGVGLHMADPGPFKSALVREVPWPAGWFKNLFSASVGEAADNIVWVAQSEAARSGTGKVFKKQEEVSLPAYWLDGDVRARLWETTEELLGERGLGAHG